MNSFFVGAFAVDLLTDQLIKKGQNGDAAKIGARAQEALVVINSLEQILSGDVADGINALASALVNNKSLDPGESLALQNLMILAQGPAALGKIALGTLIGQAEVAIAQSVLAEAAKVCTALVAAAPPVVTATAA